MDFFSFLEGIMERFSSTPVHEPLVVKPPKPTVSITLEQLRRLMPTLPMEKARLYHPHLLKALAEFGIETIPRLRAFLAQLAHESVQLRYFEEIATGSAYEGRKDLGNTEPGDGIRFKGRGP